MEVPGQNTKSRPAIRAQYRFRSRLGSPYTSAVRVTRHDYSQSSRFFASNVNEQQLQERGKEESDAERVHGCCRLCHVLVENKWVRRFFRVCAVVNLLSLMFSSSLYQCDSIDPSQVNGTDNGTDPSQDAECHKVFVQYVIITSIDFVLAVIYTVQFVVRINYGVFIRKKKVSYIHVASCFCSEKGQCHNFCVCLHGRM